MTTIDRAVLRQLASGWRPMMTVEVRVCVLVALLDTLDRLEAEVEQLRRMEGGADDESRER